MLDVHFCALSRFHLDPTKIPAIGPKLIEMDNPTAKSKLEEVEQREVQLQECIRALEEEKDTLEMGNFLLRHGHA